LALSDLQGLISHGRQAIMIPFLRVFLDDEEGGGVSQDPRVAVAQKEQCERPFSRHKRPNCCQIVRRFHGHHWNVMVGCVDDVPSGEPQGKCETNESARCNRR